MIYLLQLLHFLSFIIYFYLAFFISQKGPKQLLNRLCSVILFCFGIWSFSKIFIHSRILDKNVIIIFSNIGSIGWIFFSSLFLWASLVFYEKYRILKSKLLYIFLFIVPIIIFIQKWNGYITIDFIEKPYGWAPVWGKSIFVYLLIVYTSLFMFLGIVTGVHYFITKDNAIKRKQAKNILLSISIVLISGITTDLILPRIGYYDFPNIANIISLIWTYSMVYSMIKYRFLSLTPSDAAENIISTMPDSLLLLAPEGDIISVNNKLLELSGYKENELIGKPVDELFLDEKPEFFIKSMKDEDSFNNYEMNLKTKSGESIPISLSGSVIKNNKKEISGIICIATDMTRYKKNTELLLAREELHLTLIETSPNIIFRLSEDGIITMLNSAFERLTGMSSREWAGKSVELLIHPDDLDLSRKNFEHVMEGQISPPFEARILCNSGNYIIGEFVGVPVFHGKKVMGALGFVHNITIRKKAENKLRLSEERYKALFDRSLDSIFIFDFKGNFSDANKSALSLTGYNMEELQKINFKTLLNEEQHKLFENNLNEIISTGFQKEPAEYSLKGKEGNSIWIEIIASIIYEEGIPASIQGISRDITDRKESEDKLKKSFEALRKTLGSTVQAMAMSVEARDPYTAGHQRRVADLARSIAVEMNVANDIIDGIRISGAIHDIGKISIPAEILSKPAKLLDIEFLLIQSHPKIGYDILKSIEFPWPVAQIVYQHHERIDGSGYPRGLSGKDMLQEAKILAVADVVEAMASHRPYRPSLGIDLAIEEITKNRGRLYDPDIVDACINLFNKKGYNLK